jgi:tetratricopeptide (TPR) repeat protein
MRTAILSVAILVPSLALAQYRLPKGVEEVNTAASRIVVGDYAGAEPLLRRAIIDAPNDPWAHFNLASVLRATNRNDQAIAEYHIAKALFQAHSSANGAGDVGNCLYGIALADEAKGNPAEAARAWQAYVRFAEGVPSERAALAIARNRVDQNERLAAAQRQIPGRREATRRTNVR